MSLSRIKRVRRVERLECRRLLSAAYSVVDIGSLGGSGVFPAAVADNGDVVGYASLQYTGLTHAFRYTHGVMTDLGTLGGATSAAQAINNAGQIVGSSLDSSGHELPFLYQNGAMKALPLLAGDVYGQATGISATGIVVGWEVNTQGFAHPVQWIGGVAHAFSGGPMEAARAINNIGQTVGTGFGGRGFIASSLAATPLAPAGAGVYDPAAINSSSQVVGTINPGSLDEQAFLYRGGAITNLGTLGGSAAVAYDINDGGTIVGDSTMAGLADGRAFVDQGGSMTPLDQHVPPGLALTFISANAINTSGQIASIASNGHAYLLTPVGGGSISGTVFNDSNGDGIRQPTDTALANFTVYIDSNNNGVFDPGEVSTKSASNGTYRFDGLAAGTFVVRMQIPDGSQQTVPTGNAGRTVKITSAQNVTGQDFADRRLLLYRLVDLGTLGGASSSAADINNLDQVVGTADTSAGLPHAFVYSSGKMTDLGTLGGATSHANAINNRGQIVGGADTSKLDAFGNVVTFGFTRSIGGTMMSLGTAGGHFSSDATDINDAGQIVGSVMTPGDPYVYLDIGSSDPFIYSGQKMQLLTLGHLSAASAINNSGQILIVDSGPVAKYSPPSRESYLYQNGHATDLGTAFPNGLDFINIANKLNDHGQIVGASGGMPFIYSNGTYKTLGTLTQDEAALAPFSSQAYGINNLGWVVGTTTNVPAFLYNGGSLVNLTDTLAPGSGWTVSTARGINDSNWIVGTGVNASGQSHAIMLVPVLGSISGSIYGDFNSNGARDSGEYGLSGHVVYLDANHNGKLDSGETTTTTDGAGNFKFGNLWAGSYDVREVLPTGWRQTTPAGALHVNLDAGGNASAGAFGTTLIAGVPAVSRFILVNADTDKDIMALSEGMTLDLSKLPRNLNIRAITSGNAQSVQLTFDGRSRLELQAPWAVFGDWSGDFVPGKIAPGQHTLTGRAFSGKAGSGVAGAVTVLHINVVGQASAAHASSLILRDALTASDSLQRKLDDWLLSEGKRS